MQISLFNKKALVGGATAGIGKAIAMQMAVSGASVTLMARNEAKLQDTLAELPATAGQKHQLLVVDFNQHEAFKVTIRQFFEHNQIDILVNNTNGPAAGTTEQKDLEDYQQAFNLLFQNNCFTTLEAIQGMKAKNFGRIINVSSLTVKEPVASLVLSNTMRTALMSWSKSLAYDVAPYHITVNSILTGLFDTERITSLVNYEADQSGLPFDEVMERKLAQIPVKRLGKPEEYGYLATFLASEYAAYLTGANIPLDGGMYKGF
jgi:3-oxoacyl-[acyl-carrier protein] reductase